MEKTLKDLPPEIYMKILDYSSTESIIELSKTSSFVDMSSLKTGFYALRINGLNYTIIKD